MLGLHGNKNSESLGLHKSQKVSKKFGLHKSQKGRERLGLNWHQKGWQRVVYMRIKMLHVDFV